MNDSNFLNIITCNIKLGKFDFSLFCFNLRNSGYICDVKPWGENAFRGISGQFLYHPWYLYKWVAHAYIYLPAFIFGQGAPSNLNTSSLSNMTFRLLARSWFCIFFLSQKRSQKFTKITRYLIFSLNCKLWIPTYWIILSSSLAWQVFVLIEDTLSAPWQLAEN